MPTRNPETSFDEQALDSVLMGGVSLWFRTPRNARFRPGTDWFVTGKTGVRHDPELVSLSRWPAKPPIEEWLTQAETRGGRGRVPKHLGSRRSSSEGVPWDGWATSGHGLGHVTITH